MPFSLAIFSADSPIVRPVVDSAMAGASAARSFGRRLLHELRDDDLAEIERGQMRVMRARLREGRSEPANDRHARRVLPHAAKISTRESCRQPPRLTADGLLYAAVAPINCRNTNGRIPP